MSNSRKKTKENKNWEIFKDSLSTGGTGAGATSIVLSAYSAIGPVLGAAALSNPVALGAAGGACALFCCINACVELQKPEKEDVLEQKLDEIKSELDDMRDVRHHQRNHRPVHLHVLAREEVKAVAAPEDSCCGGFFSIFSKKRVAANTVPVTDARFGTIAAAPVDQQMPSPVHRRVMGG